MGTNVGGNVAIDGMDMVGLGINVCDGELVNECDGVGTNVSVEVGHVDEVLLVVLSAVVGLTNDT